MLQIKVPPDSFFRPTVNLFTADYNSPTAGKYDWAAAANQGQEVIQISPENLYLISIINFGATIDEAVFLNNVQTIPQVTFKLRQTNTLLYGGDYPVVNYLKNNEIGAFFWTRQRADDLLSSFNAVLGQDASLAGVPSITAHVSLNIFEIIDQGYINRFFGLAEVNEQAGHFVVPPDWRDRV